MEEIRNEQVTTEDLYKAVKYDMPDLEPTFVVNGVYVYVPKTKADLYSEEAKEWFREKTASFRNTPLWITETKNKTELSVIPATGGKNTEYLSLPHKEIEGVTVYATEDLHKNHLLELRFCVIANLIGGFTVNPGDGMLPDLTPDCWTAEPWEDRSKLSCPYPHIQKTVGSVIEQKEKEMA